MISYTVDDIMAEGPCQPDYPRARVVELFDGRESITPRDIAALDIPTEEKIWALSILLWRLSPHRVDRLARMFALEVAHLWDCPDHAWWYLVTGDESSRYSASVSSRACSLASAWYNVSSRACSWASAKASVMARARARPWHCALASASAMDAALDRHLGMMVSAFEVTS